MNQRSYCLASNNDHGFSLIEAAIVLGLVGVVIGGLWIAASTTYENLRISRSITQMTTVIPFSRSFFANEPDVGPGVETDMAQVLRASGKAPADMFGPGLTRTIDGFSVSDFLISPWGEPVSFYLLFLSNGVNGNPNPHQNAFAYSFWNLPTAACVRLISSISSRFKDNSDLMAIYTRGGSIMSYVWTIPVAPNSAPCTSDSASGRMTIITFFFRRIT